MKYEHISANSQFMSAFATAIQLAEAGHMINTSIAREQVIG